MLISFKRGQTSVVLRVKILNSSVSTGAGLTGLTSASSGLIISTIADNEASATAYTVAGSTIESITTLGTFAAPTATKCRFKEVDSTNHKGVYEIQIADARFAVSSAKSLLVSISGATNAAETDAVIPLQDMDPYDVVRGGMTALPNTACTTNASLITSGTGTAQLSVSSGQVILQTGTGTGQLDFTSGVVKCNNVQWLGGTIPAVNVTGVPLVDAKYLLGTIFSTPATAGIIDVNLKNIANAAVSTSTAQLGVNVVNFGGSAGTFASGRPEVNTTHIAGTAWASTTLFTLASHDPGATIGTSTLTQTQISGGAYALNSASFAFNSGLDFTTTQKAATLARVTLTDTITTYTGNTVQTGDSFARIGLAGVGLTNVVLPSGGLANVTAWTVAITGNVTGNLSGSVGSVTGTVGSVTGAVGSVTGAVGSVTAGVNLASTGLDSIATTAPAGVASTFREMNVQLWRRFFAKSILDADTATLKTYAADGTTVVTTQTVSTVGNIETQGNAS